MPRGINLVKYLANKFHHYLLRLKKSSKVAYPSAIMFELTNLCNLKCITCAREYKLGAEMNKGFLKFDAFKKIFDELNPYVDSIGLTGLGETLLYKQLTDVVDYIRSRNKGVIIFISTNAHLPDTEDIISSIADKIDTVQISIDGTGDVHNSIRRGGDYSFFIANTQKIIDAVKGLRADVMFNMVVFEENYRQMAEVVMLAERLGVKSVFFNTMNILSTDWDTQRYEFYHTDSFIDELSRVEDLAIKSGIELTTFDFTTPHGFRKCGFPWNHFYITWDGFLVPCCAKPFPLEMNFGNAFKVGLQNCLNSASYRNFRNLWYKNITPDFCENCHTINLKAVNK